MTETRYIAVVDDHLMIRKGLCSLIDLFPPYKVLFDAGNGKEMISMLDTSHTLPDIVLLDITMPSMDGYETARWLKDNHPDIKVLALSTMDSENAIIGMLRSGAKGYILKDSDPAELRKAFDSVLKQGYYYNDDITNKLVSSLGRFPAETADNFTPREREFLKLSCSEKTYQEIANEMKISERTVEGYRESLFKKIKVSTRVGLVLYAIKKNLVQL